MTEPNAIFMSIGCISSLSNIYNSFLLPKFIIPSPYANAGTILKNHTIPISPWVAALNIMIITVTTPPNARSKK